MKKFTDYRLQWAESTIAKRLRNCSLLTVHRSLPQRGFTLIETFVAISILTISIVAPMTLAAKSLSISYYVRDEVTASYLAQEAIETIRNVRDSNILNDLLTSSGIDQMTGIPSSAGAKFTVDAHVSGASAMQLCPTTCPPVQSNGTFYGYPDGFGTWVPTRFTRTVTATYVDAQKNDLRLVVGVTWTTGGFQTRKVTIAENLYRWTHSN